LMTTTYHGDDVRLRISPVFEGRCKRNGYGLRVIYPQVPI
jgi:hypothetical protein